MPEVQFKISVADLFFQLPVIKFVWMFKLRHAGCCCYRANSSVSLLCLQLQTEL